MQGLLLPVGVVAHGYVVVFATGCFFRFVVSLHAVLGVLPGGVNIFASYGLVCPHRGGEQADYFLNYTESGIITGVLFDAFRYWTNPSYIPPFTGSTHCPWVANDGDIHTHDSLVCHGRVQGGISGQKCFCLTNTTARLG